MPWNRTVVEWVNRCIATLVSRGRPTGHSEPPQNINSVFSRTRRGQVRGQSLRLPGGIRNRIETANNVP